jgi:hypothetical protein
MMVSRLLTGLFKMISPVGLRMSRAKTRLRAL